MKRSRNSVPKKGRAGAEAQRRERESMQDWKKKKDSKAVLFGWAGGEKDGDISSFNYFKYFLQFQ